MTFSEFLWRLYQRALPAAHAAVRLGARFHPKWKRAVDGSEETLRRLEKPDPRPSVWIHAASAGELEQARPILRELRKSRPGLRLAVTCFSPAGVELAGRCEEVDLALQLPLESSRNARRFFERLQPRLCIIVGADLWPSYLLEAARRNIPCAVVNAFLRPGARRLWPGVRWPLAKLYRKACVICCVAEADREAMARHLGVRNAVVCGNTRFDQVQERASRARPMWEPNRPAWILGSTWPEDESVFLPAAGREPEAAGRLWIVVPHECGRGRRVRKLCDLLAAAGRKTAVFSEARKNGRLEAADAVVVDRTGILMDLYRMAEVACVGGAFGPGVHSVLEPAAFGLPILFGPKHKNSEEAVELIRRGAAFSVRSRQEAGEVLGRLFHDTSERRKAGERAAAYVRENLGATQRILAALEPFLPTAAP